jgi:hypothetical protein
LASITVNRRPISRYRARVPPRLLPPAPPWVPQLHAFRAPPPLWHFVFLSMLLHLLLIALFGAPSGGSREGRAMWGSMQVELRGLLIEATPARPTVPLIEVPPPAPADPFPAPTRSDRAPRDGAVPLTPPADTQAGATAPSGPTIVEVPAPFPPLLDRIVRPEPRLDEPPPLRVPPPTSGRDLRPPPRERPTPAPTIEVPAPLPLAPAPVAERVLAEPPAIPAPVLQPVPVPAPQPRVAAPSEKPPTPEVPLTRPVETPPVEVRAVPVPSPLESAAIPRPDATTAPVELAPTPRMQAAPAPTVEQVAPRAPAPPAKIDPETPRLPGDARAPLPGEFRRPGPARRGDEPSSSYDPTAPALDTDAIRNRAGQIAREGSGQRALLPFPMPPVPEKKSKMESAIENARKPDCRTAYQGLGIMAVVPLVANEFGEGTCRW